MTTKHPQATTKSARLKIVTKDIVKLSLSVKRPRRGSPSIIKFPKPSTLLEVERAIETTAASRVLHGMDAIQNPIVLVLEAANLHRLAP
jgi:hypothetical protein